MVSNAGAAWQGRIGEVDDSSLRESFELNFFAHQTVAQNAVRVMRTQGWGNAAFQRFETGSQPGSRLRAIRPAQGGDAVPGSSVRPRYGRDGIRSNAVNADHIRSGMLTSKLISARAQARGVTESEYLAGNLLGVEVTAADVAQAFVHQALQTKSTANVTTVDGGNIAAALR